MKISNNYDELLKKAIAFYRKENMDFSSDFNSIAVESLAMP